jgi:uncharacterized protein
MMESRTAESEPRTAVLSRAAPSGLRRRKSRPVPGPSRLWGWRYAMGACVVVLGLDFALAAAVPRHLLGLGIGSLALDTAMLLALVPLYRRQRFVAADLGLRRARCSAGRAVVLVFAALILYLAVAAVWALIVLGQHRHQIAPQLQSGAAGLIVAGLAMCLVAPTVEELFFRGFVYRALRNRMGVTWAVVIVAVLFAAAHASTYPADTLPIKALFAVITCLLYERTRSLYPGIAPHCLIDASGYEASVRHGAIWIAPTSFAALGLIVWLRSRLRAPTADELAAGRRYTPPDGRSLNEPWPAAGRGRMVTALVVRFGYHSPQWVLGALGILVLAAAMVGTIINAGEHPYAHPGPSAGGDLLGLGLLLGLAMILTAVIWRFVRRRDRS